MCQATFAVMEEGDKALQAANEARVARLAPAALTDHATIDAYRRQCCGAAGGVFARPSQKLAVRLAKSPAGIEGAADPWLYHTTMAAVEAKLA